MYGKNKATTGTRRTLVTTERSPRKSTMTLNNGNNYNNNHNSDVGYYFKIVEFLLF